MLLGAVSSQGDGEKTRRDSAVCVISEDSVRSRSGHGATWVIPMSCTLAVYASSKSSLPVKTEVARRSIKMPQHFCGRLKLMYANDYWIRMRNWWLIHSPSVLCQYITTAWISRCFIRGRIVFSFIAFLNFTTVVFCFIRILTFPLKSNMTRAKDVLPNINCTQAAEITPAATEWSRLLLHDVICS